MSQYIVVAGILGMLSSTVGIASVLGAIVSTENFSWATPLSNMGHIKEDTASTFNSGLMVSGLLGLFFATGLLKRFQHIASRIGASLLVITSIALFSVGLFPLGIDTSRHVNVSYLFFISLSLTLVALGIGFAMMRQGAMAVGTLSGAALAVSFGIIMLIDDLRHVTLFPFGLAEFVPSLTLSAWIFFMGLKMAIQ